MTPAITALYQRTLVFHKHDGRTAFTVSIAPNDIHILIEHPDYRPIEVKSAFEERAVEEANKELDRREMYIGASPGLGSRRGG